MCGVVYVHSDGGGVLYAAIDECSVDYDRSYYRPATAAEVIIAEALRIEAMISAGLMGDT